MALFRFTENIFNNLPIDVYHHGQHRRDFTYIDDIVAGVVKALDYIPQPNPDWRSDTPDPASSHAPFRIYNIGNQRPIQLLDYIAAIEACTGRKAQLNLLPMQPGDVAETYAEVDDLVRDVGYAPNTPIEQGIGKFIDWYRTYYGIDA